ncbi:MAG: hypothetical protein U0350_36785 [Caldilineaceae bacterium]
MWQLDYTNEVKLYFIDNGDLVFDVLVKIEELKFTENGIPREGCTQIEPGVYLWEVLRHAVIYHRREATHRLRIAAIKPLD